MAAAGKCTLEKCVVIGVDSMLINACYDYREEGTRKREIKGLVEAMNDLDLNDSHLFTWDKNEKIKVDNGTIIVRPLWDFLMNMG